MFGFALIAFCFWKHDRSRQPERLPLYHPFVVLLLKIGWIFFFPLSATLTLVSAVSIMQVSRALEFSQATFETSVPIYAGAAMIQGQWVLFAASIVFFWALLLQEYGQKLRDILARNTFTSTSCTGSPIPLGSISIGNSRNAVLPYPPQNPMPDSSFTPDTAQTFTSPQAPHVQQPIPIPPCHPPPADSESGHSSLVSVFFSLDEGRSATPILGSMDTHDRRSGSVMPGEYAS